MDSTLEHRRQKKRITFGVGQLIAAMTLVGILLGILTTFLDTHAHSTSGFFMWPSRRFGPISEMAFGFHNVVLFSSIALSLYFLNKEKKFSFAALIFVFVCLGNYYYLFIGPSSILINSTDALNRAVFALLIDVQLIGAMTCESVILGRGKWNYLAIVFCVLATVAFWFAANYCFLFF